jgi:hypothetical protein
MTNMTPETLDSFWGNHIKINVNPKDLDFSKAKEIAKKEAKKTGIGPDAALLL